MAAPSVLRTSFWLSSLGLHVAVFAAASSPTPAPVPTEPATMSEVPLDVTVDRGPLPVAALSVPDIARVSAIVPPLTLTRAPHSRVRAPVVAAAETVPSPAHFTMTVSAGGDAPGGTHTPSALSAASIGPAAPSDGDGAPLPETGVSSPARLSTPTRPQYPPQAIAEEVEADVMLSIVVASSGTVTAADVTKPAGFGFDETALRWIRGVRFVPALRNGKPVAVRMRWPVSFRLR